jgi:hypothetical protein
METSLKRSCLGALYLANTKAIQTTCKFKVDEAREKIFELAENTWDMYSTGTLDTNQVCPYKNMTKLHQIKSGNMVSIDPGRYIWTMDHVILADKSEMGEMQMKTMVWAGEVAHLFGRANTEAIHLAIQGVRTKYNGEFDASKLVKQLDQCQYPSLIPEPSTK